MYGGYTQEQLDQALESAKSTNWPTNTFEAMIEDGKRCQAEKPIDLGFYKMLHGMFNSGFSDIEMTVAAQLIGIPE